MSVQSKTKNSLSRQQTARLTRVFTQTAGLKVRRRYAVNHFYIFRIVTLDMVK